MKYYQILAAFILFPLTLNANCIKGNCVNGTGVKVSSHGDRWEGHFVNARLTGTGYWKSPDGSIYKGDFKNGHLHGKGRLQLPDGGVYIGQFVDGKFDGTGRFKYSNGDMYFGQWKKGHMHGDGAYTFSGGKVIKGQFADGAPVSTHVDKKDRVQPQRQSAASTSTNTSSSTASLSSVTRDCTSDYCDGVLGIFKYADGSRYIGEFKNGQANGVGRCEYINGDVYEGGWDRHSPHGKGVMHFASGQKYAARWEYGSPKEQLLADLDYITSTKKTTNRFNERVDIYALVVGVASYQHMQSLKYTDDDAYQVYAFLKSPEGGAVPDDKIKVLIDDDATKSNILMAMDQLFSKADANDMVFLYLSGHGLEGSFIPSDFNGYSNNIPYRDITKIIDRSEAKSKICIADACHSGSLVTSKTPYQARLDDYHTMLNESRGGTALLMSSAAEEKSLEYSGLRQGVFSHFLLSGMRGEADADQNKIISITELFRFISTGVSRYTASEQTPMLTGRYDPDMPIAMIR